MALLTIHICSVNSTHNKVDSLLRVKMGKELQQDYLVKLDSLQLDKLLSAQRPPVATTNQTSYCNRSIEAGPAGVGQNHVATRR